MSKKAGQKPPGLKISELAKRADVTIPTIKHYLKEGLLPRPIKTGRTMSYYDEACVDRVRLIKRLQNERFLPLYVIKQILESDTDLDQELILREGILGVSRLDIPTRVVSPEDIEKATGYGAARLKEAERMGVILPQSTDGGTIYDTVDLEILSLIRKREDIGIPFEYTLEMMSIYKKYMKKIVEEDGVLFVRNLLSLKSTEEVITYVWEGDSALVAYMPLIRAKLTRANVERLFRVLRSVPELIDEALNFRCLPGAWETIDRDLESIDPQSVSWRLVAGSVVHPERRDDTASLFDGGPSAEEARELLSALCDITRGRADDALSHLAAVSENDTCVQMKHALLGVAYIIKATQTSRFMPIIDNIKNAMSHFDRSRETSRYRSSHLFATYIRGMGLSVIPEEFGAYDNALLDLTCVIEWGGDQNDDDKGDIDFHIIRELIYKSTYFLVLMQRAAGRLETAVDRLGKLIETGAEKYYLSWAKKTLKEIKKELLDQKKT
ncbi:MAG: MerR family transcriptional regulator [Deltaproteobacteria bacterium]|nr:MerR family transcriptional regulator [Candidatus Zymogenaceae bacterium]